LVFQFSIFRRGCGLQASQLISPLLKGVATMTVLKIAFGEKNPSKSAITNKAFWAGMMLAGTVIDLKDFNRKKHEEYSETLRKDFHELDSA
jgi:hypothetical protein